jgi:cobalamin synthase
MAAALLPVAVAIAAMVRFCARNRGGMTTDVADFVNETVELTALVLLLFQPLIAPFIG